ncbi:MAG: response regulator [Oscillospiraceae bacterium]|jgi:HPt (histidine-containing phosphotransfer) domain-containing protein|nr:response regulator [Oscillospiraceae bacterium]
MIQARIEKGEKPFDLILMDIFMPVMDGMEAATKIIALDTKTPIVAVTANIMASELEKYKKYGMHDYLGKPFTSQELWRILLKYLTPSKSIPADENEGNDDLQEKLRINFIKNNKTMYNEITEAVTTGDMKLAHRLAHTLKGSAGMVGKTGLKNAAAEIEMLLREGVASIWETKMNLLKTEFEQVIEEFRPLLDKKQQKKVQPLNAEQTLALFEKLEPMLENINPECTALLGEIRAVPGTEELVRLIEDYDFESAAKKLAELKEKKFMLTKEL